MGHIEATKNCPPPRKRLWATVSDLANWDKWFTVHEGGSKSRPPRSPRARS